MEQLMNVVRLTRSSQYNDLQVDELARLYQETQDERYLESLLYNIFPFIIKRCNRYMTLNEEDKTSVALERLYIALTKWDPNKGKFLTLYGTILNNELICMLEATQTQKARAHEEGLSLEMLMEDGFQTGVMDEPFSLIQFIMDCKFNELETQVVTMLSEEYLIREICENLKISRRIFKETMTSIQIKVKTNYKGTLSLDLAV